jgi:hypothetical protein
MFENIRVFDEEMKNLHKACGKIVELYARMWDILGDVVPDIVLLERVCMKLIDERNAAEMVYHKILRVTNNSLSFLTLMTLYSKFIAFDDLLFSDIQEKLKKLEGTPSVEDSLNIEAETFRKHFMRFDGMNQKINMEGQFCSISISFSLENIGQIVWSSESCYQIFFYESSYLRTFNIAHLLPGMIAKNHHDFLRDYFMKGKAGIIDQMSHLWAIDKNKTLFSLLAIIKLFISKEGLTVHSALT